MIKRVIPSIFVSPNRVVVLFRPMDDVLTAGLVISNDERDGEGIELKCLIQTE